MKKLIFVVVVTAMLIMAMAIPTTTSATGTIAEDVTACDVQTASTDDQHFFNEVPGICYLVAGDFWYQWRGTGMDFGDEGVSFRESLALWGYPLSRAFEQKLEDGSSRWVQYFERARFEFYPENVNTPYVVQQGHFGRFVLQMGIGGNTPLPGEAECVVAHEYQLKDLTQISADREFLHVQFWWEGVPERETLLPPGTYPIGSDWTGMLQGMVWELGGPNCTAEVALRDYLAPSIQRRMNAGYLHWTWLVEQGIVSVAWQPNPVPTIPDILP